MLHPHSDRERGCAGHGQHGHGVARGSARNRRALWLALAINAAYTIVEFVGGILTGSLALVADAGHMLLDVASLALALLALWFAQKAADPRRTFGYLRSETLAALVNGATLTALCAYIFYEAGRRFFERAVEVDSLPMLGIAAVGLAVNAGSAWLLRAGQRENLNVRGVFLHLAADALGSVGAIAAGAIMYFTRWPHADPIAAVVIGVLILYSSWVLVREAVHVLMQGTPAHVDLDALRRAMLEVEGVVGVHDLHVWTMGAGTEIMSGHAVLAEGATKETGHAILIELSRRIRAEFGIEHTTIQIEHVSLQDQEERACWETSDKDRK